MNSTFVLNFALALIGGLGAVALLAALLGLPFARLRPHSRHLILFALPAGLAGIGALHGVASLTQTAPAQVATLIAFFCGAGVGALAWIMLRRLGRGRPPPQPPSDTL